MTADIMSSPLYIWQRKGWPKFHWDARALQPSVAAVAQERAYLEGLAHALDDEHLKTVIADLTTDEAVSTAAIEGVKLDPASVRSSVMRRLGFAVSKEKAHTVGVEARGLLDVLVDSIENAAPLTRKRLLAWQAALFPRGYSSSLPVLTGAYRGSSEPMQIVSGAYGHERVHYEAPPASRLPQEMTRFLRWFNGESRVLEAPIRASIAHLWFETLHPFEDGNGRIGRAIFDLAITQSRSRQPRSTARLWSVSRVFETRREQYYAELEAAQKGSLEITAWLMWSLQCIVEAHRAARAVVERVNAVARFWVRHSDKPFNARQRKVLRTILQTDAQAWVTTRAYARITGFPKITAARDLAQLVEWTCITADPTAGGRSTRYRVAL
ncbi:MAG: DUF4172 domain-containing protein [Pseudomonadota bacterium]